MRVRRAVLGEIKEKKEGGLYYTKPFRRFMNALLDVKDFFDGTLKSERAKVPEYFYRQMLSFYKSATFIVRSIDKVLAEGEASLEELRIIIEREKNDLMRFKQKIGDVEVYLYADRIARRTEILEEIQRVKEKISLIGEENTAFAEFYQYLCGEKTFSQVGCG